MSTLPAHQVNSLARDIQRNYIAIWMFIVIHHGELEVIHGQPICLVRNINCVCAFKCAMIAGGRLKCCYVGERYVATHHTDKEYWQKH